MRNMYDDLIEAALALPKREPRSVPKQDLSVWSRLFQKRSLKEDIKTSTVAVYNVYASAQFGTRVLAEKVPVTELHKTMAMIINRLVATAIIRKGQLPMSILVANRFSATIDFGQGRVVALRVQLHHQPYRVNPTYASFIVEESKDLHPHEALFEHFEFDLVLDRYPPPSGDGSTKGRK
jgi:hypothetical protein